MLYIFYFISQLLFCLSTIIFISQRVATDRFCHHCRTFPLKYQLKLRFITEKWKATEQLLIAKCQLALPSAAINLNTTSEIVICYQNRSIYVKRKFNSLALVDLEFLKYFGFPLFKVAEKKLCLRQKGNFSCPKVL